MSCPQPQPPAAAVTHFLAQSGVAKLVVGHQPHGDAPVVISDASVQVITGDTSYATGVRWDPPSPPSSSSDIEPGRRLAEMIEGIRRAPTHHLKPSDDPADTRGVAASEVCVEASLSTCIALPPSELLYLFADFVHIPPSK